jgi:acyloxyacyl hydrolase
MAPPDGIVTTMKQRNVTDESALVIYALIGNDVCSGHKTFGTMTTPQEFAANVLASLEYLDTVLTPNSYVVFLGLADGRILYDTLAKDIHPVGTTYADLYDYLNCLDTSPCWGWMNSNSTVRNTTYAIANSLNAVYPQIIANYTFNNFKMLYAPPNLQAVVDKWIASGKDPRDLIEPIDGFHPSQAANILMAENLWDFINDNMPEALGPINPFNAQITQIFGDQGGY